MKTVVIIFILLITEGVSQQLNGILLLGDSNTEVSYLPDSQKWSSLISDSLDMITFNKGVSGSDISHSLDSAFMQTWKSLNAKYVIMCYGLNNGGDPQFENYQRQLISEVESTGAMPVLMTNLKVDYEGGHYSYNRNSQIMTNDNIKRNIALDLDLHLIDIYYIIEDSIENGNWDHRIRNPNNCLNNDNYAPHLNHQPQQYVIDHSQDTFPNHLSLGATWFTNIHYNFKGSKIVAQSITNYFRENILIDSNYINMNLKIFLEGPYEQGSMNLALYSGGFLPLYQPYNDTIWNYIGNENVSSIPDNVVDWILVELRESVFPSSIIGERACFVLNNGFVVDLDGSSKVKFDNIPPGDYYVVVKHRNHLSIMTNDKIPSSKNSPLYDFSSDNSMAYGFEPMVQLSGNIFGLPAGDGSLNGVINILDYKPVADEILTSGYKSGDYDMNGVVNILDYSKTGNNLFKITYVPD